MGRARSGCREYRLILLVDLPRVVDDLGHDREATDGELMQKDIHIIYRGATNALALCNGYLNKETRQPEDAHGNPWPGERLCGGAGIYREKRLGLIAASLITYKDGNNSGHKRLMLDKRPEEFDQPIEDGNGGGGVIPAVTLTSIERLSRNLPRIMGDG